MRNITVGLCPINRTYSFQREFRKIGINPITFNLEDVIFDVEKGPQITRGLKKSFEKFDCIISRRFAAQQNLEHVAYFMDVYFRLEDEGICFINSPRSHMICVDKLETLVRLQSKGISTPRTIALASYDIDHCTDVFHELGSDIVVKPLFGSKGKEIIRVQDEITLRAIIQMLERQLKIVVLEEFIPSDSFQEKNIYEDIRIFVAGNEVIGTMKRQSKDWITNIANDGIPVVYEPDEKLKDLAMRCCDACELFYGGVDVIISEGTPIVIEVNSFPGWEGLQKTVKRNIPARIVSKILEHLKSS